MGTLASAPMLLGTDDEAGTKTPVLARASIGTNHDWGELPSNIRYGNTHSVVEDSQGRIYIHHTVHATSQSPDPVVVFDAKGKFVRSFGAMFKGGAHGMHYAKEGKNEYLVWRQAGRYGSTIGARAHREHEQSAWCLDRHAGCLEAGYADRRPRQSPDREIHA